MIYIVEDDAAIRELEQYALQSSGYEVQSFETSEPFWQAMRTAEPELVILDVMLPGMNGFSLCETIRRTDQKIGIIILSAKGQEQDKIRGLSIGADDYMTKPFEIRELLMRIQAISRRSNHQDTSHPVVGNLSYDPATCEICNTQTQKSVQVSGKEMQLLEFFMNNCNQVLEKNQITTKIWGFDSNAEYNNVEVYVSFLRRKFHHLQVNVTIRAIRGVGYIMEVSDD